MHLPLEKFARIFSRLIQRFQIVTTAVVEWVGVRTGAKVDDEWLPRLVRWGRVAVTLPWMKPFEFPVCTFACARGSIGSAPSECCKVNDAQVEQVDVKRMREHHT
jgi:hypothetical protein